MITLRRILKTESSIKGIPRSSKKNESRDLKKGYRYMGMHNQDPIVYNKDLISVFIFIMKTLWKFHFQRDLYPSFVRTYMVVYAFHPDFK